ncbi:hypothetical protein K469DRAFT_717719 [Zopfia rhizophila CBS 207.26]|uniref:Uncharacterized protein n=1 Tax=Zopfia rhizophila CBS 207.26 TaxID=1314779 RepID=A0A6A6DL28_9PEZI|nr:hypothetical protein K469DRAFT_717719 [Zopfia rhizophila CBS 207.26]
MGISTPERNPGPTPFLIDPTAPTKGHTSSDEIECIQDERSQLNPQAKKNAMNKELIVALIEIT